MSNAKLTSYQLKLFIFLCVATFFEGFDFIALTQVIPEVREVNTQLVSAIEDLGLPERLLTADPDLTGWHEKAWKDRQTQVTQHYAAARRKLEALHERANARAVVMAKEMAEERSPLDAGETGDAIQVESKADSLIYPRDVA